MFNFLSMMGNYEERKVDNTIINDIEIDTCAVTDSLQPYETGICSEKYNDGKWVIVEMYETLSDAIDGHKKWVEKMSNPPESITDVSTSEIKQLANIISSLLKNQRQCQTK